MLSTPLSSSQTLLRSGARRLVISELPAMGCTPGIRQVLNLPSHHCSTLFKLVAEKHNELLGKSIARLREIHPAAFIVKVLLYQLSLRMANYPALYGEESGCNNVVEFSWSAFTLHGAERRTCPLHSASSSMLRGCMVVNHSVLQNNVRDI